MWKKSDRKFALENDSPVIECLDCKELLSIEKFYSNPKGFFGTSSFCKECSKKRGKNWRDENKDYSRDQKLKKNFAISLEIYNQLYKSQDGKCKICDLKFESLTVDHDHSTGKVRALLCDICNRGLGHFHDDAFLLGKAIEYLNEYRELK